MDKYDKLREAGENIGRNEMKFFCMRLVSDFIKEIQAASHERASTLREMQVAGEYDGWIHDDKEMGSYVDQYKLLNTLHKEISEL